MVSTPQTPSSATRFPLPCALPCWKHAAFGLLALAGLSASAPAMFMAPQLEPVDRLVKNAQAYLAKHPKEADAYYTLGRIHYLAFSAKRDQAPVMRGDEADGKPKPAPRWLANGGGRGAPQEGTPAKELTAEQAAGHAANALKNLREALRMEPKNGLYALGIASLLEEVAQWKAANPAVELAPELKDLTPSKVLEAYSQALALALPADSKLKSLPIEGLRGIVSHEAAEGFVRVAEAAGGKLTDAEKASLEKARKTKGDMEQLPMRIVTPMVFSFQPAAHLAELLAPERRVQFDLEGFGRAQSWPWVKPELGLVVWDPLNEGRITSGRQLFGGYTFQIFRKNGYDALAGLDDNGDGVLSGPELEGLSVWFDANSDGQSAPAEVTPLSHLGIRSLATAPEGMDGQHPTHSRGLLMEDGRALRTWDWMVQSPAPVRW